MRRNFAGLFIVCSGACDALIVPNCGLSSMPLPLPSKDCTSSIKHSDKRYSYRGRISCMMASSSEHADPSESQAPARRKRTVSLRVSKRSTKSEESKPPMKRRKTATIKSPKMVSLNSRRKSASKTSNKNTDGALQDISTRIPHNLASGAVFQRNEMVEHTLLTKEEEIELGRRVVKARELREKVENLVEEQDMAAALVEEDEAFDPEEEKDEVDMDFLSYELEYLSLYGFRPGEKQKNYDLEDDLMIDHVQHRSLHLDQLKSNENNVTPKKAKRSGYRNGSSSSTANNNSYTPLLHIPIHQLSDVDVVCLGIPGGKAEAIDILLEGAHAREMLMRKNIKLVISIAKNWMKNSFTTQNANFGKLSMMYEGSWDRPSLDEAVQEGVLGLARAVDKYDPEKGYKFSTYATHWVTSYVRVCFQRASTGCLRVPSQLHDIKAAYKRIVKNHYQESQAPLVIKSIAKELGISEKRLQTAIRATKSLESLDAPVVLPGSGSYKGSAAGVGGGNSQELLLLDTLRCSEPKPEDQVEISFLRQCLENAMATELTPFERDILRMRLGLDSGESKKVRQIVEICGGSITTADVRAAERRAFKKLRSPTSVHTANLLAYLDMSDPDREFMLRR